MRSSRDKPVVSRSLQAYALFSIVVIAAAVLAFTLPSCSDQQLQQAKQDVQMANDQLSIVQQDLNNEKAAAATQPGNPKIQASIDKLSALVDKWKPIVDGLNVKLQAAQNPNDAIAASVQAVGTAAAPFAGPYAPLVLLAVGAIPAIITRFVTWKKAKAVGAGGVAAGIEAGRNDVEEQKLQGKFIVVEKATSDIVHSALGVKDAIADATKT